jgi:hypothetical protein
LGRAIAQRGQQRIARVIRLMHQPRIAAAIGVNLRDQALVRGDDLVAAGLRGNPQQQPCLLRARRRGERGATLATAIAPSASGRRNTPPAPA